MGTLYLGRYTDIAGWQGNTAINISIYTLCSQEISSLTFHTFRKYIPIALIGRGYGNEYSQNSNNDSYNNRYGYGNYKCPLRQRRQQRMDNGQQTDSVVRCINTIEKSILLSARFLSSLAGISPHRYCLQRVTNKKERKVVHTRRILKLLAGSSDQRVLQRWIERARFTTA